MKNLNWSKMRFICIFLAFSLVILGYFFRNHYYYQFLGEYNGWASPSNTVK